MRGDSKEKKQRFCELGSKWNELTVDEKEAYNTRASVLNASNPPQNTAISDSHRSKRIMMNMMKQVCKCLLLNYLL